MPGKIKGAVKIRMPPKRSRRNVRQSTRAGKTISKIGGENYGPGIFKGFLQ
nr:MAG TPA: hypothetical protein [Caudoviricetes sp.]